MKIHPTALVSPSARLAEEVELGAYACIGEEVEIAARPVVQAHAVPDGLLEASEEKVVGYGDTLVAKAPSGGGGMRD